MVVISNHAGASRLLYSIADDGRDTVKKVTNINAYLVPAPNVIVNSLAKPVDGRPEFISGNVADDDGQLIASSITDFGDISGNARHIIRPFLGSFEFINGRQRRSEEHTSELQSLMRISYAVFCLKKKKKVTTTQLHK